VSIFFGDNKAHEGHGRQSLHSGAFSLAARAINAAIQVGSVLFLARLLSPEDYGLVAMVLAVTGFAPVLVDLGTRDAVVQRERISEGEISSLFWLTIAIGTAFTLLVAASGPVLARLYDEPRLTSIALVSSLIFITTALSCQHHALLRRAMMFQQIALIEIVANVLGAACAIGMAFYGLGYWALVVRPLVTAFLVAVGVWLRSRWIPIRPVITGGVKDMLKFGAHLTGFCMTDFVARCSDRVAIGMRSGAKSLGYYQQAMLVYDNVLELTVALHGVAVASLSKLRDNVTELRRLWGKGLSTLAFYGMPAFGLLAVTSQDLIVLLLGNKWASAGLVLSVLALRGIPHVVERTVGWLHVAAGRADRWARWGVFAACAQIVALFCGLPFGPMGIATAYAICMYVLVVPAITYGGRPLGITATDVVGVIIRPLSGALIAAGIGFALRYTALTETSAIARLALLTLIYALCYLTIVVGLLKVRTPLHVVMSLARNFLPRRLAALAS
jgi:polysaccharide transporter, PST family